MWKTPRDLLNRLRLPLVWLGGIDAASAAQCAAHRPFALAARSALCAAEDPAAVAATLVAALQRAALR